MDKILVDKEGYKQFFEELDRLKNLSVEMSSIGNTAYKDAIGDGWHDNFAFEDSMRESRTLAKKIDDMQMEIPYLEVIENLNKEDEYINIGDTFEVEFIYSSDDVEKEKLTLTGKYIPDNKTNEITLNSPIGRAVLNKKINTTTSYFVNDKEIKIRILNKI